jgi:hypothetical protein
MHGLMTELARRHELTAAMEVDRVIVGDDEVDIMEAPPAHGEEEVFPAPIGSRGWPPQRRESGRLAGCFWLESRWGLNEPACAGGRVSREVISCLRGSWVLQRTPLRQEFQMAETSPLRRRMIEDMTIRNLSPAKRARFCRLHQSPLDIVR